MSDLRMTKARLDLLDRGVDMAHAGGFYTADLVEYNRCEALRSAGLLRFWNGRRCMFWRAQFFDITDKGREVRLNGRRARP